MYIFNYEFIIIDFSTPKKTRCLAPYDRIFYVCASHDELRELDHMTIGRNPFIDDFNRLHHIDDYKSKCIDVTFLHCPVNGPQVHAASSTTTTPSDVNVNNNIKSNQLLLWLPDQLDKFVNEICSLMNIRCKQEQKQYLHAGMLNDVVKKKLVRRLYVLTSNFIATNERLRQITYHENNDTIPGVYEY
jgi:hypothetical protein